MRDYLHEKRPFKQVVLLCLLFVLFSFQSVWAQQPGNALLFDGSNDCVQLPPGLSSSLSASSNNGITIEYWYRGNSMPVSAVRFQSGNNYIVSGYGGMHCISTEGGYTGGVSIGAAAADGRWHHIAMTWAKGQVNGFKSYLDGQLIAQKNASNTALPSLTGNGYLGSNSGTAEYLSGSLDEVRIYNTSLSQANIQSDMVSSASSVAISQLAYYTFNQGIAGGANTSITTLRDSLNTTATTSILKNFAMTGASSNFIESYAMVVPVASGSATVNGGNITINWTAPSIGIVNSYRVEVSTNPDFTGQVSGSPFTTTGLSQVVSGLSGGTYYYRVRAFKTTTGDVGCNTQVKTAAIAYTNPGNALSLDGSDDYVSLPNGIMSGLANSFTVETWFAWNGGGAWQRVFDFGTGSGGSYMLLSPMPGGISDAKPFFQIHTPSVEFTIISNTALVTGKWYHIALTLDASSSILTMYINGENVGQATGVTLRASSLGNTTQNWLGRSQYNDPYFNGKIDEFHVWNTARTQAQIRAGMSTTWPSATNNLIYNFNFDQGVSTMPNQSVNTLIDIASSANGTLNNFALSGTTSNWTESYAMAIPVATAATLAGTTGFTANWNVITQGSANTYFIDVSTSSDFKQIIAGSPFSTNAPNNNKAITGLLPNTNYYYRIRAERTSVTGQGGMSNTILVRTATAVTPPGNALAFDGVKDMVTIPNAPFNLIDNLTMEAWVFPTQNTNAWQCPFSYGYDDGVNGNGIAVLFNAGYVYLHYPAIGTIKSSFSFPVLNHWYHIALTRVNGIATVYVDGVSVVSGTNVPKIPSRLHIGSQTGIRSLYGQVDEFKIYSQALSAAQIMQDMRDTNSVLPSALVAYYNFDEGTPGGNNTGITILTDKGPNQLNGVLSNTSLVGTSSNWVSSYALVVPTAVNPTAITANSFTANWTVPKIGTVSNYILDVSTTSDFSAPVSGSPFSLDNVTLNRTVTGLISGTYYYRVRAANALFPSQGAWSNTMSALVPYAEPGNALALDGTDNFISIPASTQINNKLNTNNITVEAWVKMNSFNFPGETAPALITEGFNGDGVVKYAVYFYHDHMIAGFYNGSWHTADILTSKLELNRWTHIASTYDQQAVKIYINGVLVASNNVTLPLPNGSEEWYIGKRWDFRETINAAVDEVRIWNIARTPAQLFAGMHSPVDPASTGLVAYYNFNQGVAAANNSTTTQLNDIGPYAMHGQIRNSNLSGTTQNWIESYAMVTPYSSTVTNITPSSFKANWTAPITGSWTNYYLDVASTDDFKTPINGSPFNLGASTLTRTITDLTGGVYYYRVRANKASTLNQGGVSTTVKVDVPYTDPGNALAFDGNNDHARSVTSKPGNFGTSDFTVEYWLKTIDAQGYHIAKRGECAGGNFWSVYHGLYNNPKHFYVELNNGGNYPINLDFIVDQPINDNRWHHFAMVRQGIRLFFYIDNVLVASGSSNGIGNVNNGGLLVLANGWCWNPLSCSMDELRLWNVARTQEQLRQNMDREIDPNTTGLSVYYNFDQGDGGLQNYGRNMLHDVKNNPDNDLELVNLELEALNTNWVQSYATVVPTQTEPSDITPNGFTLNWTSPPNGPVSSYYVDISLSSNFTAPIPGSPFIVAGNANSYSISGLASSKFYCRVRANMDNSVLANEGAPSNVKIVDLKYTPPGNALQFDGNNDYGTITRNIQGDFTVEYWMRTTQTGNNATNFFAANGIVDMEAAGPSNDFGTGLSGNKLICGVGETSMLSISPVNTGKWIHVAFTRKQSDGTIKLYINGNLESSAQSNTANLNAVSVIRLGCVNSVPGNSNYSFNGAIDELRIWNVVRTQQEIFSTFNDTVARNSPGLVSYYNMDQGIGGANNTGVTTLIDIAGTDNGGTITNFALTGVLSNWVNAYNITVASPTSLIASTNICSRIDLNWQIAGVPSTTCDAYLYCDANYFRQYVYADDSLIAIFPYNTTSCSFYVNNYYNNTKLVRGIAYKFKVVTVYLPSLFHYVKYSNPTNIAIGQFKDNPEIPAGFKASLTKCDGSIDLEWTWTSVTNPQNGFLITRGMDTSMANAVNINVQGQVRSYTDAGLQRGQLYLYRIYAKNDCFDPAAVDTMMAGMSDTMALVGGKSPTVPNRATNVRLFSDSTTNQITVRWNDNSDFEEKYSVDRVALSGGTASFDVNPNDTVFVDDQAAGCVAYNYTVRVYSGCATNGIPSIGLNQTRLTPILSNTFEDNSTYMLRCSKGYYPDRVELNWNNRNNAQLSNIRIYRKIANSNNDSILIASVLPGSGLYIDNTTVAGILYRYYLIGETQCAGVTRYSNVVSDIGFRSPSGIINGTISYSGGYAVQGVRVLAQNTSTNKGGGVLLSGNGSYISVKHKQKFAIDNNALTIESWYKPISRSSFVLFSKHDTANQGITLAYDSATDNLRVTVVTPTSNQTISAHAPFVSFTSFNQITATIGLDSLRLYINGMNAVTVPSQISSFVLNNGTLFIGGDPNLNVYGNGNLDEFRVWKIAKTKEQITNDYNRTVESNDPNLLLYYTFDDRFPGLKETYDQSNVNLVFNENHASFVGATTFTDSIPSSSQLALASYTDKNGNYTIANVRYIGTGQNYTIVPSMDIHTFSPTNHVVFVGDGSQSINGQNFLDNSSFEFTGYVHYAGTTCPASGASVLIDGQHAVLDNQSVLVNDSGKFTVRIPIGQHAVSLSQTRHTFSQGRFPARGLYNFDGPVAATFVDSTFLTVVGRVAGGNRELNKLPGMGRSKNNIGKASMTFSSVGQSGITGCFTRSIVTNDSTGEYTAHLLPLRYTINNLRLVNNPDPTVLLDPTFNNPNVLDLTTIPEITNVYDTLVTPSFTRIDSVSYHTQLDFRYYVAPKIYVTNVNTPFDTLTNNFIGENKIAINDTTSISVANNELGYPVFMQSSQYWALVKVIERYTNIDKPATDSSRYDNVPVAGTLRFNNELALNDTISEMPIDNGQFVYGFRAGIPNQLRNALHPQYNYTRTMQIEFVPEIGYTVSFNPNETDPVNSFYRAFIFGSRPGGNNFTTRGPALVDFVLRDPPGSLSSTTWSKGTSFTKAESYSFENSFSRGIENQTDLGEKLTTFVGAFEGLGAGVIEGELLEEETVANFTLGVSTTMTTSGEGEIVTSTTMNTTISTGSDPGSVGPMADVYYGKSINIIFGNSDDVELIDTATCAILAANAGTDVCSGNEVNGYRIGKKTGFFIVPGGIATTFAYTQDEIINQVIPDLAALRNQLLTNSSLNIRGQKKYTPVYNNTGDPDFAIKFGSNNDDPIWQGQRSTPTPFVREASDSIGMSYIFRGNSRFDTDSIRFYNDQIRLWKSAIARNEQAKYKALNNAGAQPVAGGRNISIGKAMLTEDFTTQVDQTYTESFEVNFEAGMSETVGFEFLEAGHEFTNSFSFSHTSGSSRSTTKSISNTFSYTLQDGDDGDLISVDIVDPRAGGSHLFKLRAGHTSCPYEGSQTAMFFDPANDTITSTTLLTDGFEIQPATAQNDVPVITVDQKTNYNVPATDEAVFTLNFGNLSEGHQDRTYSLRVNEATNPYGAILKVDGLDPNRDFDVPYGTTIQKTLTIKRGPLHFDYDNIQLILKSACDDNIFDTVSVSARFLPTCTSASIKSPDNRWILNSSFHDTLPVTIGGYNYNWGGFKTLTLQYRPGSTNTWYTEKIFYKDTNNASVKIPIGDPTIFYPFNFKNLPDGNYEIRVVTECIVPGYPNSRINSDVMQGLVDRVNPTPFGTPSPANGILSPNDDISIQFNEPIEQSTLSVANFDIKGVLNKSNLRSNTSLHFDGDNDYLEVDQGMNLQLKPFTLESWHKRNAKGAQVLFSQGADTSASFELGFTSSDKLYFKMGNEVVVSNTAFTDTVSYHFIAVSYNSVTQTADLYVDEQVVNIGNNRIFNPYNGSGRLYLGKAAVGNPNFLNGNLYEARIWNTARTLTECSQTKSILLNGTESGLMANWRMDEASGKYARDYARSRNATIVNAQWYLTPMGKSYTFDGNGDYIIVPTSHFGITKEMDFTLEFWFKGANGNSVGLLANGTGAATDANANLKWSIETDSIGRIHVKHNGLDFLATDLNYFDGNWHHFALVLRRNSSMSCYVDAQLQNAVPSGAIEQFGGLKLWIGARGWNNNGNLMYDSTSNYFNGQIDDVRFWNCSRLLEQLQRDKNTRLIGDESGLLMYYPFESYKEQMGVAILDYDVNDFASTNHHLTNAGNATFSSESPTLKLPRGAQHINFTYGVNNDKIIITPTTANEYIENVTLDITVKGIQDKNGNSMQSPKTWIAYVDRNQVKWQDDALTFTKNAGAPLSFTSHIVNSGGALKSFSIGNLPNWLHASVTSGTIAPSSTMAISFTVDQTLNIGKYEQDLSLNTDFGFADKLLVKVNVNAIAPKWDVNTAKFAKTMNIVGQVRINNVISANTDDLLGAFVGNECRGIGHVQYYDQLDKYLVFMDVYGNTENEPMEFRIWNSATGKTHIQVTPSLNFVSNSLVGSVNVPQIFNAFDKVFEQLPLSKGWNWISFNLLMTDSSNLNVLFNGLKKNTGNIIKNNTEMAVYDTVNGWSGNLNVPTNGVHPESTYLLYVAENDTLELRGIEANPLQRTISVNQGWNYLGFVSQRNMSVNDALAGWTPSQNDLLKGQVNFAVYDTVLGWVGSLTAMIPNTGYLYRSATSGTFHYPRSAMFGKDATADVPLQSAYWKSDPHTFSTTMNAIVQVNACSNLTASGQLRLGAFVNGNLRGFCKASATHGVYFLSINGQENENIQFRLLDERTGAEYELTETMTFVSNSIVGTLSIPIQMGKNASCGEVVNTMATQTKVYPIPFSSDISIDIPNTTDAVIAMRMVDISGKTVMESGAGHFAKGLTRLSWNTSGIPAGVYIIEIENNAKTERFKVVKVQQ